MADIYIFSNDDEIDRMGENDVERQPRNWPGRVWWWSARLDARGTCLDILWTTYTSIIEGIVLAPSGY